MTGQGSKMLKIPEHRTNQEGPRIQRSCTACEEEQSRIQRSTVVDVDLREAPVLALRTLMHLQRTLGNRAVQRLISRWLSPSPADAVQSNHLSPKEGSQAPLPVPEMVPGYQRRFATAPVPPGALLVQRDKIDHRALTWEDFKGKAPKGAAFDALTASDFADPDLKAVIPKSPTATDTGDPCKSGKRTKFKADITIDASKIDVKSFFWQEKSWRKLWTTDEAARKKLCKDKWAPKCEKAFDKAFEKIPKAAAKQCKPTEADCKKAFKEGSTSFEIDIDGTTITASSAKECTKILLPDCKKATEKVMKDGVTWEASMSGAAVTVTKRDECRKSFIDDCATTMMQAGSDALLKHEQAHFDLTDAMAQKAQSNLRSLIDSFPKEVEACGKAAAEKKANQTLASELAKMKKNYADSRAKLSKLQSKYDAETKHGTVEKKQAEWEKIIKKGF